MDEPEAIGAGRKVLIANRQIVPRQPRWSAATRSGLRPLRFARALTRDT
jgi:hypothetical protein